MRHTRWAGAVALALATAVTLPAAPAQAATAWDQGFETDTDGWHDADSGWHGSVTRVEGPSSEGDWHAVMEQGDAATGPFSRFDRFRSEWPGNYVAEMDVYLDPGWESGSGFDYSVAASGSDGAHQRDFIFHVAKDEEGLLVAGSNNTDFTVREDLDSRHHYVVEEAGWYTLQHHFRNDGDVLAVDLNLLDSDGTVLFTETRQDPSDTIGEDGAVGGNGYAWFTVIDTGEGVRADAHELILADPTSKQDCKGGGWQDFGNAYANQGQCVADVQSNGRSRHHR